MKTQSDRVLDVVDIPDEQRIRIEADGRVLLNEQPMDSADNPGMAALACHLAQADVEMPTAAVAVFDAEVGSWSQPLSPDTCRRQ